MKNNAAVPNGQHSSRMWVGSVVLSDIVPACCLPYAVFFEFCILCLYRYILHKIHLLS